MISRQTEVRTQAEFDAAFKADPKQLITCLGNRHFVARGSSRVVALESSSVVAWGSSSVVARGSSSVVARGSSSVEARESSSVEAWGSSSVVAWESSSVVAWGSSRVVARGYSRVVARGYSRVEALESSSVVAGRFVAVQRHGNKATVKGGVLIDIPVIATPELWLDYYGIPVKRGVAILFKALDDNYVSSRNFEYRPGTKPKCPDWDPSLDRECGGGLHFCPAPGIAAGYHGGAVRYAACPVKAAEIVVYTGGFGVPDKVRAPRVCGPVVECDRDGAPIQSVTS